MTSEDDSLDGCFLDWKCSKCKRYYAGCECYDKEERALGVLLEKKRKEAPGEKRLSVKIYTIAVLASTVALLISLFFQNEGIIFLFGLPWGFVISLGLMAVLSDIEFMNMEFRRMEKRIQYLRQKNYGKD